jgi:hypothetical protein
VVGAVGGDPVSTVVQPVVDAMSTVSAPVVDVVSAGGADPVSTVLQPVADGAGAVVTPVTDAVTTVAPVTADALNTAATPVAQGLSTVATPAADAAHAISAPVADAVHTVATGPAPAVGDAAGSVVDALSAASAPLADAVSPVADGALAAAAAAGSVMADMTGLDQIVNSGAPLLDGGPASALDPVVSAIDGIAGIPDAALLAPAAVLAVTIFARYPACSSQAAIVWDNVKLIPCMARDTVRRGAGDFAFAFSGARTAAPGRVEFTGRRDAPAAAAAKDATSPLRHEDGSGLDVWVDDHRTGGEPVDGPVDGAGDSRLMIQLGVVFGLVYAAFVTFWVWLTRIRLGLRPRG